MDGVGIDWSPSKILDSEVISSYVVSKQFNYVKFLAKPNNL